MLGFGYWLMWYLALVFFNLLALCIQIQSICPGKKQDWSAKTFGSQRRQGLADSLFLIDAPCDCLFISIHQVLICDAVMLSGWVHLNGWYLHVSASRLPWLLYKESSWCFIWTYFCQCWRGSHLFWAWCYKMYWHDNWNVSDCHFSWNSSLFKPYTEVCFWVTFRFPRNP